MHSLDVIVIGAGQAGLAAGYHLQQAGLRFVVLEAGERPSGAWRHYYDNLKLFSPARYSALPGLAFPGDPDHYPDRDEVVTYLESYARHFELPIAPGRRVEQLRAHEQGYLLRCADGSEWQSAAVIVASGAFGTPYIPRLEGLTQFRGQQLHSADYRRPEAFAGKRVVVVGGANSGVQIARELAAVAEVTLVSRRPLRFFPQQIFGKDFHFWVSASGLERTRWLSDQSTPVLDDGRYQQAINAGNPPRRPMFQAVTENGVIWADGRHEAVDVLLFATGFRPNVSYLAGLDLFEADGQLRQRCGVARGQSGLYFVGLPRQRNFASATLRGVGPDAAYVVNHLMATRARAARTAACCGRLRLA
ncbi:flavin-containing monooxygenase [Parachitinimonas caeni]|uniref:NAD(P)-binding domain-containing protein n=1 Tax=Parachitinimonas caeni TaxID=3031301 RepID=A0ABT7E0C7_9NEIS|nr:FAD-dependent oxidoreductase [Parachitinimonas caeni]MDK2125758.1 NAD(P)-binding domain-containing protein [Parachitinimonas caeni]